MAWNRPSESMAKPQGPTARASSLSRGLIAGAVVVLGAAVVAWWLWPKGDGNADKTPLNKAGKQIKTAMPVARTAPKVVEQPTQKLSLIEKDRARGVYTNDYGYVYNLPSTKTVDTYRAEDSMPKSLADRIFKHPVDRRIGNMLLAKPGETYIGDASKMFDDRFDRQFKKSFNTPIIIEATDEPEVADLKRAVMDTKVEIQKRVDAGERAGEILLTARKELQELGVYRQELAAELDRVAKGKDITEDEMNDFVAAANKMLADRGVTPLTMPRIAVRRFEYLKKQKEREMKK